MMSKEDNERLTRVGPGTLMGDLMRQYWLPFMYSSELKPDGAPLRVRLLGEELIVFRDSNGRVGLLDTYCAHRGASLFFGRNEECGIRCVYHGWKYDVDGRCVDMPNEPAESNFKEKIHHTAYRCAEQGGVVFAYMGPRQSNPPGLPQFEWALVPENQVQHDYKAVSECNWMQALEGDLDTAHVFFLHSRVNVDDGPGAGTYHPDQSPKLEIIETEYGLMYGARRINAPGEIYWRTTQYVMPVHTIFPASEDGTVPVHIWVPIDDDHTLIWGIRWHPSEELRARETQIRPSFFVGMGPNLPHQTGRFFADWWPAANPANDFQLDRETQQRQTFTGIPSIRLQDAAMTTSMGPVMNRNREHLGTTDTAIIKARQRLLSAAKALREQGAPPPAADQPELAKVRSCSALLPDGVNWREALADWHLARTTQVLSAQAAAARQ